MYINTLVNFNNFWKGVDFYRLCEPQCFFKLYK